MWLGTDESMIKRWNSQVSFIAIAVHCCIGGFESDEGMIGLWPSLGLLSRTLNVSSISFFVHHRLLGSVPSRGVLGPLALAGARALVFSGVFPVLFFLVTCMKSYISPTSAV